MGKKIWHKMKKYKKVDTKTKIGNSAIMPAKSRA